MYKIPRGGLSVYVGVPCKISVWFMHSVYVLTHHLCNWTELSLAKYTVLFSKWFSLEITCFFPFSEVVSVPVVCLFCVSISKKPWSSVFPVEYSCKDGWFASLPRLLFLLKLISPSSRNLKSSLKQAHFLKLYLEGHQCFLQRLPSLSTFWKCPSNKTYDYVWHKNNFA